MDPAKLAGAVDLPYLRSRKVVGVGIGGALGLYEDLIRTGVGHMVLVDFDKVDYGNLTTQGYTAREIGSPKAGVAKDHLLAINPMACVDSIEADFLRMTEAEVAQLVSGADLLLMMTDNFFAQARGNRVGLKFQIPVVFAMMYERSACAEITFNIPGITPGCHRCAVSSRYAAYVDEPKDDTIQTCTTVFHTHYLNAAVGLICMGVLHRSRPGFAFSEWFNRPWDRNLVQLRLDPHYGRGSDRLFGRLYDGIPHSVALDSVWQKIEPEAPPKYVQCPDCGGTGDLRTSPRIGSTILRGHEEE